MDKALVQVYTGNGKGKTTAAVGLAVRAKSRGLRVLFAQFMKDTPGGEPEALRDFGIDVSRFTEVRSPLFNKDITPAKIRQASLEAIEKLMPRLADYDLVILDEFCHLLRPGILTQSEAMELINSLKNNAEIVITGRGAPGWLIEAADLVTEMQDIKHPASKGLKARKGIEY